MKTKYNNIFWYQGLKAFDEERLKSTDSQLKISHLENDVTKSLLNVFQPADKKYLQKFLQSSIDINGYGEKQVDHFNNEIRRL